MQYTLESTFGHERYTKKRPVNTTGRFQDTSLDMASHQTGIRLLLHNIQSNIVFMATLANATTSNALPLQTL